MREGNSPDEHHWKGVRVFRDIQQLNRAVLLIVQRMALDDLLSTEVLFGTSAEVAKIIRSLSLEDIEKISKVTLPLVELRNPQDIKFWQQITTVAKDKLDPNGEMIHLATALRLSDKKEGS